MNKLKVMTLVGTRPELIKLSRVISLLDKHTDHILVHSGQNYDYELNEIFFKDLEIRKPDYFLEAAGNTACETIANTIIKTENIIRKTKPDSFLIYGDTNSCMGALAAKRHKVPVFHMEAGNRCFDERVPEEINRRLVDHISDINMPLTEHGRRYLIREGIKPDTIIKTGSCMQEILEYYKEKIEGSDIINRLEIKEKEYIVVSMHREENVDSDMNLELLVNSIQSAAEYFSKKVIFPVHPRTKKHLQKMNISLDEDIIRLTDPLGYLDYIKLQKGAFCVLSDSGTITEESALAGFPAVTLRYSHERPEGMDAGVLIMSGLNPDNVLNSIKIVTDREQDPSIVDDYNSGAVSQKVLHIILSYTGYIRRTVWQETG